MNTKNLLIDVECVIPFERDESKFDEVNKTYFIIAEYSENYTEDITDTTEWVLEMAKEGNLIIKHPERFLPETNLIDSSIFPYMEKFTEYCRSLI